MANAFLIIKYSHDQLCRYAVGISLLVCLTNRSEVRIVQWLTSPTTFYLLPAAIHYSLAPLATANYCYTLGTTLLATRVHIGRSASFSSASWTSTRTLRTLMQSSSPTQLPRGE